MPRDDSMRPVTHGTGRRGTTGRYTYGDEGHQLVLKIPGVTAAQQADLRGGAVELALVADGREIVLCSRFGATIPWSHAAPYIWGGLSAESLPAAVADGCARLQVTLVESTGGQVQAFRDVRLTHAFATALDAALNHERADPTPRRGSAARPAARLYRLYHEPSRPGLMGPDAERRRPS